MSVDVLEIRFNTLLFHFLEKIIMERLNGKADHQPNLLTSQLPTINDGNEKCLKGNLSDF